jgi:hypothetical protein
MRAGSRAPRIDRRSWTPVSLGSASASRMGFCERATAAGLPKQTPKERGARLAPGASRRVLGLLRFEGRSELLPVVWLVEDAMGPRRERRQ